MTAHRRPKARRSRGFGGILLIGILAGAAAAATLVTFYRNDAAQATAERTTADHLADAKAALIAYAVSRGSPTGTARPGELPCPDTDGDGFENTPCSTAASLLGRLPWRTLGIPELRDSDGETLWYAISGPFRDAASNPATRVGVVPAPTERINSDTRGTITVRGADGATVLTNQAVAVVFAPGAALGGQQRGGTALGTVLCTLTGLTVGRRFCANNFLDSALGTNNAGSTSGPFVAAPRSASFNDKLVYIDTPELIPLVEIRVANELKRLIAAYRANSVCQCYPWADTWEYSGGIADVGQNRGRFATEPYPENWGEGAIPELPVWLGANNWHNLFWFSVAGVASDPGKICRTCSSGGRLTLDSVRVAALLFTPGTPPDGVLRVPPVQPGEQSNSQQTRADNISVYLHDAANADAAACSDTGEIGGPNQGSAGTAGALSCDQYVTPTSKRRDRNRVYAFGMATGATCAAAGQQLASIATTTNCHLTGNTPRPECVAAAVKLDACGCRDASRTMLVPPCRNGTNPPQCQTAVAALQACAP